MADDIIMRGARPGDAVAIWRLVSESEALETNTCYAYVLLCSHFRETCVVAERGDAVVGFVAAYRPPVKPDVVFVWQVGVAREARGRGLATRLLEAVLARPACADVTALEATVTPSNAASRALFTGLARRRGVGCDVTAGYPGDLFGEPGHEPEQLYHIGPLGQTRSLRARDEK